MLVLASASPRRRELLMQVGFSFEVRPAHIPEEPRPGEEPIAYVTRLARQKAEFVYAELSTKSSAPLQVVGADTTVTLDDHILGKPEDAADAARMLRLLSGRTHRVITGVAVVSAEGSRSGRRSDHGLLPHANERGDCGLHRHRRTHGQSRSLRDSRPRGALDSAHRGLLFQCGWAAYCAGLRDAGRGDFPQRLKPLSILAGFIGTTEVVRIQNIA